MARVVSTSIRPEPGDVLQVDDDQRYRFFIVYCDKEGRTSLTIDDVAWSEAEALAHAILDGIAARRARTFDAVKVQEHVSAEPVL